MVNQKFDKNEFERFIYVPFPEVQKLMDLPGFGEHSVAANDGAYCVSEDWIDEHTDNGYTTYGHSPSYGEISEYEAEFRSEFDEPTPEEGQDVRESWEEALNQYIAERTSGEVDGPEDFAAKYNLK